MQTTLETLGQLERRLHVAVPRADIDSEVKKRLQRLAKTIKIAGFRPGKVPLKMVEQYYGPQVRSDVISDTVQQSFNDAVREQKLRIAGTPRIEPRTQSAPAPDQVEFSAVFEVYPEIHIGDVGEMRIVRPRSSVTPDDVAHTLEVLRKQKATYASNDAPAAADDRVVVDFTGTIDGVAFAGGQAKDFPITLGEGRMLPEFDAALRGAKAGEHKHFSLRFPDDYHGKEVAAKSAVFEVDVKDVLRPQLPPIDAEFAKTFGIASGSVDELRAEVEANLNLELKRKIEARLKDQVLHGLRQGTTLSVPKSLVDQESEKLAQRMAGELRQQAVPAQEVRVTADMVRPQAEERVAMGLIVGELVRAHGLEAKPAQVRAMVEEAAQSYEQPAEVVRWHYEEPERLNDYEVQAVERNVIEWVLAHAKVEDQSTTLTELMEPAARQEPGR